MFSRTRSCPAHVKPSFHLLAGVGALILFLFLGLVVGCGGGDDGSGGDGEGVREEALESLAMSTEAARLEGQMAELAIELADDPTERERELIERRLAALEERAAELIANAGADSTYEVELEPVNRSDVAGTAILVEADGEVAIEGELDGARAGNAHPVAVHAHSRGASICPPEGAARGGAEGLLGAREAADFYGREAVEFNAVRAEVEQVAVTDAQEAGEAPPLSARALVISGGEGPDGYDPELPVACGTPATTVASGEQAPRSALVAGSNETRAALLDLRLLATVDPASSIAQAAQQRAWDRAQTANERLRESLDLIVDQLEQAGALSDELRSQIEDTLDQLNDSGQSLAEAFQALEAYTQQKLRERRQRQAQREAELEAQQPAPAPEPAPPPEPEPTPAPQPEPTPAPEPEPSPAPPMNGLGGPDCSHPLHANEPYCQ